MADPAFQYDSNIWLIVHECAEAAATLTTRRTSGLVTLERYDALMYELPNHYVDRILDVIEKVVQSRLAGRQPRLGHHPEA
jgi:hypothetical protein